MPGRGTWYIALPPELQLYYEDIHLVSPEEILQGFAAHGVDLSSMPMWQQTTSANHPVISVTYTPATLQLFLPVAHTWHTTHTQITMESNFTCPLAY